jgi:hypothetical protein
VISFFRKKEEKLVKFTLEKHISPKNIYQFFFEEKSKFVKKKKNQFYEIYQGEK